MSEFWKKYQGKQNITCLQDQYKEKNLGSDDITLRDNITEIYKKYNFRASPVLDQAFLIDESVIHRALDYAQVSPSDTVLEIGPGLGFITKELCRKAGKVIAIERDKRLQPILADEFKDNPNVSIIYNDALRMDFPSFNKIVSNIPFSISSEITFKLLNYDFDNAVLFYQREFGEKMLSKPGSEDYGRLSIMAQYYFDIELKERVPKDHFYPQPKVDSVVLLLKKKPVMINKEFDNFIMQIFRYKNKNVSGALKIAFNRDITDDRKLFTLSIDDLLEVFEKLR